MLSFEHAYKTEEKWKEIGLDELCIPIVQYFNRKGLKTDMCCQGHNKTNMSMFWISFDEFINELDIINFMEKHLSKYGPFISNGKFANRIFLGLKNPSTLKGDKKDIKAYRGWYYFAATPEAAMEDLKEWERIDEDNKKDD